MADLIAVALRIAAAEAQAARAECEQAAAELRRLAAVVAEMRNALESEKTRAEMRLVAKGWPNGRQND